MRRVRSIAGEPVVSYERVVKECGLGTRSVFGAAGLLILVLGASGVSAELIDECVRAASSQGLTDIDEAHRQRLRDLNAARDQCATQCLLAHRFNDACIEHCNYDFNVALGLEEDRVRQKQAILGDRASVECNRRGGLAPSSQISGASVAGPPGR